MTWPKRGVCVHVTPLLCIKGAKLVMQASIMVLSLRFDQDRALMKYEVTATTTDDVMALLVSMATTSSPPPPNDYI